MKRYKAEEIVHKLREAQALLQMFKRLQTLISLLCVAAE